MVVEMRGRGGARAVVRAADVWVDVAPASGSSGNGSGEGSGDGGGLCVQVAEEHVVFEALALVGAGNGGGAAAPAARAVRLWDAYSGRYVTPPAGAFVSCPL
jgi:hypothetical protein